MLEIMTVTRQDAYFDCDTVEDTVGNALLTYWSGRADDYAEIGAAKVQARSQLDEYGFEDWFLVVRAPTFGLIKDNGIGGTHFVGDQKDALSWALKNDILSREQVRRYGKIGDWSIEVLAAVL